MQANEVLNIIKNGSSQLAGKLLTINPNTYQSHTMTIPFNPQHADYKWLEKNRYQNTADEMVEITPEQIKNHFVIYLNCPKPHRTLLKNKFIHTQIDQDIPRKISQHNLSTQQSFLVVCLSGISSLHTTQLMRNTGYPNTYSLKGDCQPLTEQVNEKR